MILMLSWRGYLLLSLTTLHKAVGISPILQIESGVIIHNWKSFIVIIDLSQGRKS